MHPRNRFSSGGGESRRNFIKKTAAGAAAFASNNILETAARGQSKISGVTIVYDVPDSTGTQAPVRWAMEQLRDALKARGVSSQVQEGIEQVSPERERILVAHRASTLARQVLDSSGLSVPDAPESLELVRRKATDRQELLVCGADARGLVYGILEVADRVTHASDPLSALRGVDRIVQQPANPIRSVTRLFTSEAEDKPWFYDKSFWQLGEVSVHLQALGRAPLRAERESRFMATVSPDRFGPGCKRVRSGTGSGEPRPAAGDDGAPPIGVKQQVLAGNVHRYADHRRAATASVRRHSQPQAFWRRQLS